jgi:hypothetical protein
VLLLEKGIKKILLGLFKFALNKIYRIKKANWGGLVIKMGIWHIRL